jgi:hypothetical protein
VQGDCPDALVLDLYAGCPGFNVSVELVLILSLAGILQPGDLSVIVGAENVHRAKVFAPDDTANIIFGDDAMATVLETKALVSNAASGGITAKAEFNAGEDFARSIAGALLKIKGDQKIDGIIIDNHLGKLEHRVPATAARVQHHLVEQMNPQEVAEGTFKNFRNALAFYDQHVNAFAFDVMTVDRQPEHIAKIADAYVKSGKCQTVAAVYLAPDHNVVLSLMSPNNLVMDDIDLLIEHQANFAMIPLTLEQVLNGSKADLKKTVADTLANKMVTNIHDRGNCSVVCMQRLPYDLLRGALRPDSIQGFAVNQNLEKLKDARTILYDSIGAGMTRSSFLQRKK